VTAIVTHLACDHRTHHQIQIFGSETWVFQFRKMLFWYRSMQDFTVCTCMLF